MASRAIVTLATNKYEVLWNKLCKNNWERWAEKNNYAVIVFKKPLDQSHRAISRSHAWQKLLAMSHSCLNKYETCLWLDSDILINPNSPDPYYNLDPKKIAISYETGSDMSGDYSLIKEGWQWTQRELSKFKENQDNPISFYEAWGFSNRNRPIFNTGTIGFSPKYHKEFLLDIYNRWEEDQSGGLWGEMIPFNLALQATTWQILPGKYNQLVFPITNSTNLYPISKIAREIRLDYSCQDFEDLIIGLYKESYFLHFAGCSDLLRMIGPKLNSLRVSTSRPKKAEY